MRHYWQRRVDAWQYASSRHVTDMRRTCYAYCVIYKGIGAAKSGHVHIKGQNRPTRAHCVISVGGVCWFGGCNWGLGRESTDDLWQGKGEIKGTGCDGGRTNGVKRKEQKQMR